MACWHVLNFSWSADHFLFMFVVRALIINAEIFYFCQSDNCPSTGFIVVKFRSPCFHYCYCSYQIQNVVWMAFATEIAFLTFENNVRCKFNKNRNGLFEIVNKNLKKRGEHLYNLLSEVYNLRCYLQS